jgi:hypothetical protein
VLYRLATIASSNRGDGPFLGNCFLIFSAELYATFQQIAETTICSQHDSTRTESPEDLRLTSIFRRVLQITLARDATD